MILLYINLLWKPLEFFTRVINCRLFYLRIIQYLHKLYCFYWAK